MKHNDIRCSLIAFLVVAIFVIPTDAQQEPEEQKRNDVQELVQAIRNSDLDTVKQILQNRGDEGISVSITDNKGNTPLIIASSIGRKKLVNFLLEHGANVNAQSKTGTTPLMAAATGSVDPSTQGFFGL